MRILGLEIKRAEKTAFDDTTFARIGHSPVPRMFQRSRGILDEFIYPMVDPNNSWEVLALNKYRDEVEKHISQYGSYDICSLRDFMKALCIPQTPETTVSMKKLAQLHCVKFDLVPRDIYHQIPHLANHVVSAGTVTHRSIQPSTIVDV